ncbi:unnamed protein product [Lathyrus oleraceus]
MLLSHRWRIVGQIGIAIVTIVLRRRCLNCWCYCKVCLQIGSGSLPSRHPIISGVKLIPAMEVFPEPMITTNNSA